jgi:hypothetical protein
MRRMWFVVVAAMPCVGCVDHGLTASSAVLTSGASLAAGKRTEVSHFGRDDFVFQLVDVTWPDVSDYGGIHEVVWNWYKGGKLASTSHDDHMRFASSPFTLRTSRAAATLGTGQFSVETLVDGNVMARNRFDIAS